MSSFYRAVDKTLSLLVRWAVSPAHWMLCNIDQQEGGVELGIIRSTTLTHALFPLLISTYSLPSLSHIFAFSFGHT